MRTYIHTFDVFLRSATGKLASTYLAIILLMSIGFSIVLYHTSSHELGRQIPPNALIQNGVSFGAVQYGNQPPTDINQFFQQRINEGRSELLTRLVALNMVVLIVGGGISYYLARRTLQPIEDAMAAQVQFVSDASHELRTPLAAIQTTNEVALRNSKLTLAQAKEVIQHNTEDALRLKVLSDSLLNLAANGHTSLSLGPVALQDVVAEALECVVAPATSKNISVDDRVANLKIMSDHHALAQVLIILLDNAIKYSPDNTTIRIETEKKGRYAYVHVVDQGMGIRASDIPHIFRRFYRADAARTKTTAEGYGLGLAIAQQIMHEQRGDILVASTIGKGSVFTLKIPIA